jgi:hypothetical protein
VNSFGRVAPSLYLLISFLMARSALVIQAVLMVGLHRKIADISSFLQCGKSLGESSLRLLQASCG